MSSNINYQHPYWCKFWYPASGTYEAATYSLRMKAPEIGNREKRGRNQIFARTKSGNTVVADFGTNFNNELTLNFKAIPDLERAGLLVFLSNVNWGRTRIMYEDHLGQQRYVRIASNMLDFNDTGLHRREDEESILWDFDLDVLDISDNAFESDGDIVPSALALHLADFDHPHNPKTTVSINIETKVLEQLSTTDWLGVSWICTIRNGTKFKMCILTAGHNGSGTKDDCITNLIEIGKVSSEIVLFAAYSSGQLQLKATCTVTGYTVDIRRVKL